MQSLICSLISLMKFIKFYGFSDSILKKKIHVKRVYSSTMINMYFLWWRLATVKGPHRSIWSNSKGSAIKEFKINELFTFVFFPQLQVRHNVSLSNLRRSSPFTISLVTKLLIYQKLRYASFRLHIQLTSETAFNINHSFGLPTRREMSNGNLVLLRSFYFSTHHNLILFHLNHYKKLLDHHLWLLWSHEIIPNFPSCARNMPYQLTILLNDLPCIMTWLIWAPKLFKSLQHHNMIS